jgi:hypothetical protein
LVKNSFRRRPRNLPRLEHSIWEPATLFQPRRQHSAHQFDDLNFRVARLSMLVVPRFRPAITDRSRRFVALEPHPRDLFRSPLSIATQPPSDTPPAWLRVFVRSVGVPKSDPWRCRAGLYEVIRKAISEWIDANFWSPSLIAQSRRHALGQPPPGPS